MLSIEVVYSPRAGVVDTVALSLPDGATLHEAVVQSGLPARHPALDLARTGIWGKRCGLDQRLRDGDRVEVYRALQVDPKEARRLRYRQHKERSKAKGEPPR